MTRRKILELPKDDDVKAALREAVKSPAGISIMVEPTKSGIAEIVAEGIKNRG